MIPPGNIETFLGWTIDNAFKWNIRARLQGTIHSAHKKEISRRLSADFLLPQEIIAARIRRTIDGYPNGTIVASLEILMAPQENWRRVFASNFWLRIQIATRVSVELFMAYPKNSKPPTRLQVNFTLWYTNISDSVTSMRPFVMSSIYSPICFALHPKIESAHGNCHEWLIVHGLAGPDAPELGMRTVNSINTISARP